MGHNNSKRRRGSTVSSRTLSRNSTADSINSVYSSSNSTSGGECNPIFRRTEPILEARAPANVDTDREPILNDTEPYFETHGDTFQYGLRQRTRYVEACDENLQNQWHDITGEGIGQSDHGDAASLDADEEYAQNLVNEDSETAQNHQLASLESEDVGEQFHIMQTIQSDNERTVTEAAITASMQQQMNELSERRAGRETWHLQDAVPSGDTVDGPVDVPHNLDWSRLYSMQGKFII